MVSRVARGDAAAVVRSPLYFAPMPCDHVGPVELIEMTEARLRDEGRGPAAGLRFGFGENLDNGMWASVVTEIERRGDQWIVVRLDRRREPLAAAELGLYEIPAS
jgi:hypothetical protein